MRIPVVSVLAACFGAMVLTSVGYAADAEKGPWDKFGEGSWVVTKTTSKTVMPGMDMPGQVTEMRQTLSKVTEDAYVIRTEMKMGADWGPAQEMRIPKTGVKVEGQPEAKREEVGTDKVVVEGKEYACKKWRTTTGETTVVTCVSEEKGVLKSETKQPGGVETVMLVTAFAKTFKVGDKELRCRESKTTTKMQAGKSEMVVLISDAVPGASVRTEMTNDMGATKTTSVSEVTSFEAK